MDVKSVLCTMHSVVSQSSKVAAHYTSQLSIEGAVPLALSPFPYSCTTLPLGVFILHPLLVCRIFVRLACISFLAQLLHFLARLNALLLFAIIVP